MFVQNDNDVAVPFGDDIIDIVTEENSWEWENGTLVIDGTGKLQITNTGGTVASEGGMGSGSKSGKDKGDLHGNLHGEKGGTPNTGSDIGWDPIKENIEEATAKRDNEDKDE